MQLSTAMVWRRQKFLQGLICLAFAFPQTPLAAETSYVDIGQLAARCEAKLKYSDEGDCAKIDAGKFEIQCRLNSALYKIGGTNVYGQWPVAGQRGSLRIAREDWERVIVPLLSPFPAQQLRRICIDPGHGGKDCGARTQRTNLEEKQLTLDVAKRLQKLLQKRGIDAILTRTSDCYIPLENRPAVANRSKCDMFVCIHFNAADSPNAEGMETYIVPHQGAASTARLQSPSTGDKKFCINNRHNERNLCLAHCIQRELSSLKSSKDRGVKRGRFTVLENANCPAVLVECGFMTGLQESRRIGNWDHRQAIAAALCDGICSYGAGRK
ncbi:MAG: N-acetylmuramoyl-L-alanine amidase [Puniceicoccales bacterium]|jgi:N-acetylmuramoyl-L-alanine amidase|nr:N-acetylmuramoyl-L-alanine amidase [Puniceicoccales bacterium]